MDVQCILWDWGRKCVSVSYVMQTFQCEVRCSERWYNFPPTRVSVLIIRHVHPLMFSSWICVQKSACHVGSSTKCLDDESTRLYSLRSVSMCVRLTLAPATGSAHCWHLLAYWHCGCTELASAPLSTAFRGRIATFWSHMGRALGVTPTCLEVNGRLDVAQQVY